MNSVLIRFPAEQIAIPFFKAADNSVYLRLPLIIGTLKMHIDRISPHGRQHDADREGRESQSPYPSRTGTGFHARSFLFAFRSERPLVEHLREAHEAMEKIRQKHKNDAV